MAMYPNTVTVWFKEIKGREAVWNKAFINNCRFEPVEGANASTGGDASARQATLLVKCKEKPFKSGDRVFPGINESVEPPTDSYVVYSVSPICIGVNPDHYEAVLS